MRIISPFKDYYDTAMGYGVDYESVWIREPKKIKKSIGPYNIRNSSSHNDFQYSSHNIGFCGKLYGCVKVLKTKDTKVLSEAICHSIEDVDLFIESNFKKKQIKYYKDKGKSNIWRSHGMGYSGNRKTFETFFKKINEFPNEKVEKFLIENNTPIFVNCTLNPSLKKWEFYRVIDPYTAFQEIQMFFGRLRTPEKPIPYVSDADMLEAKGFDPKWSFRKEPSKKKGKK